MAKKYRLYSFTPTNPEKYKGDVIPITLRSSWELEFAQHCDILPMVISWSYEAITVPYRDPITGKQKIYVPDFFAEILQSGGFTQSYVFEIKPMHEQYQDHARNKVDSALVARNNAKWMAATQWADRHSAEFVVLNERDLYAWNDAKKARLKPVKAFAQTHTSPKAVKRVKHKSLASRKKAAQQRRTTTRVGKASSAKVGKISRVKRR